MADTVAELLVAINGDASGLEAAISGVEAQLSALERRHGNSNAAAEGINSTNAALKQTDSSLKRLNGTAQQTREINRAEQWKKNGKAIKEFGEGIDEATKPLQTASLLLAAGGVASAKFAMDFENDFASVKKTVEGTPEQLAAVKQGIIDLTTTGVGGRSAIPATTRDLTELAATAGQLGFAVDEVVDFTEVMAQMGSATNLSGETGAQTMARFMNVTQTAHDQVRNLGSAIVYLGNNYETTEAEIASMALRLGRTGTLVGMGAADVLGYSTALSSMGIEAEAGGTAVSKSWTKIDNAVATGGKSLKAFSKVAGKSAEEFSQQWKTDAAGAFNDFLAGLQKADNLPLLLQDLGITEVRESDALKALAIGYDKVKKAVSDANTAWTENTALQKEADAMAQTTAGQLAITKNNIVEAARSIGETMLPTISKGSTTVKEFAQNINKMSDESKERLVKTGAAIVGIGAAAKGLSSGIKTVGTIAEGIGKVKEVVPKLADVGKAIASGITSPVGIAALAATGLAVAGKTVYDAWYKNKYLWSDGFEQQSQELQKATDSYTRLVDLRNQYNTAKKTLTNPAASTEEIDTAKAKIEEIKGLLEQEYNLKITSDTADLDNAFNMLSAQQRYDVLKSGSATITEMHDAVQGYKDTAGKLSEYNTKVTELQNKSTTLSNLRLEVKKLNDAWEQGTVSQEEYNTRFENFKEQAIATGEIDHRVQSYITDATILESTLGGTVENIGREIGELSKKYSGALEQREKFKAAIESSNDSFSQLLANDIQSGNMDDVDYDVTKLYEIGMAAKDAGVSTDNLAKSFAAAKTGYTDFAEAVSNGKAAEMANNFIDYKKQIGDFVDKEKEVVSQAALIKNGFSDISQVDTSNMQTVSAILADMQKLGQQQGLFNGLDNNGIADKLNEMAHAMQLLPDNKTVTFNAETNGFEVVDQAKQQIDALNKTGNVKLTVDADGNVQVLETADEKLKELVAKGDVKIKLNFDTGGADIFNKSGSKIGEITAEGKINWTTGDVEKPTIEDEHADVVYGTDTSAPDAYQPDDKHATGIYGVDHSQVDAYQPEPKYGEVIYTIKTVAGTVSGDASMFKSIQNHAKGTQNFHGGLAMVNDQRGVPDPRELVIDRGRAFIPEGRDVILPLSKGAKVYTAKQTREIMNSLGIPHYAGGKDNSDAFTTARDDWTHYTKTHAVGTAEELKKWVEFSKQFTDNMEDVADIEEEIYSLTRKQREEMNDQSNQYLENLAYMYQWEELGDNDYAAWQRVEARNREALQSGKATYEEYYEAINSAGVTLFENRKKQSLQWLEHERKYNNMSTEDYMAGLERIQTYTQEYYDSGLIDLRTFYDSKLEIGEEYLDAELELVEEQKDAAQERVDAYFKSADNWKTIRDTFDDWEDFDDNYERYYTARLANVEKLFRAGDLDPEEYMDRSMDEYLNLYKATKDRLDDELSDYRKEIDDTEQKFRDEEQALRDSWTVQDRSEDIDEVNRLLGIYKNASTEAGQQKYKDLLDQKKQLDRDEEIYQLQQDNNEVLETMEEEYTRREEENKKQLKDLRTDTFDIFSKAKNINIDTSQISALVDTLSKSAETSAKNNQTAVNRIIDLLSTIANKKTNPSSYTNNSHYTISGASENTVRGIINGTVITGLGGVLF